VPEDEPTAADGPRSTFRPPSRPEISETDRLLGQLLASQSRLEAAWKSRAQEYETFKATVGHVHRCVDELRRVVQDLTRAQAKTGKTIGTTAKVAPIVIAIVEVLRAVASNYLGN
jgi:hypothetical protein